MTYWLMFSDVTSDQKSVRDETSKSMAMALCIPSTSDRYRPLYKWI